MLRHSGRVCAVHTTPLAESVVAAVEKEQLRRQGGWNGER